MSLLMFIQKNCCGYKLFLEEQIIRTEGFIPLIALKLQKEDIILNNRSLHKI